MGLRGAAGHISAAIRARRDPVLGTHERADQGRDGARGAVDGRVAVDEGGRVALGDGGAGDGLGLVEPDLVGDGAEHRHGAGCALRGRREGRREGGNALAEGCRSRGDERRGVSGDLEEGHCYLSVMLLGSAQSTRGSTERKLGVDGQAAGRVQGKTTRSTVEGKITIHKFTMAQHVIEKLKVFKPLSRAAVRFSRGQSVAAAAPDASDRPKLNGQTTQSINGGRGAGGFCSFAHASCQKPERTLLFSTQQVFHDRAPIVCDVTRLISFWP